MGRKAKQVAEEQFRRYGATQWRWVDGHRKHDLVFIEFGVKIVRIGFAHGNRDENLIKRVVAHRLKQEGIPI